MSMLRRGGRSRPEVPGVVLFGAGAGAGWLAAQLNRRRRHMARDRVAAAARSRAHTLDRKAQYAAGVAKGVAYEATGRIRRAGREYDDVTLARKVETELFRPADAPKGKVDVNVQDGVVELRGEVEREEQLEALAAAAARVEGVKGVHNLMHLPGSAPKHSPPSEPGEVRERFRRSRASSHHPNST